MEWNKIVLGSCIDLLPQLPAESVDLVFADPPFNIGLKYDVYEDRKGYSEYLEFTRAWLSACQRVLKPNGSIFVAIGDEYSAEVNIELKNLKFNFRNWLIWHYTFGENQRKKFSRCKTHIHYFTKSSTEWIWNADEIKVPSARQIKYNDKRAKSGGKVPDDVWDFEPDAELSTLPTPNTKTLPCGHEMENYYFHNALVGSSRHRCQVCDQVGDFAPEVPSDVWKMSRVCGTFKERILKDDGSAHPCQMPETVLRRIIKVASNPGDVVLDPFCGTATTSAVAKELGRQFWTCDVSMDYCKVASARLFSNYDHISQGN